MATNMNAVSDSPLVADEKLEASQRVESTSDKSTILDDQDFTQREQSKIIHRVDRRLVTTCGIMYCISLMDRSNLGQAAIAGMTIELNLDMGFRFSLIALVFFVTYILFQPPATVLCRWIGPRVFLPTITFLWGVVMIGMGFSNLWTTMIPLRMLLGLFEAGFFPGCVYLLSTWYVRYELQKRYSVFYLIGSLAASFTSILAYGLMQMDGLGGLHGWRWIFIMQGLITVVVAGGGYFGLVDFPDRVLNSKHFLSERECKFILRRVEKDRGDSQPEKFTLRRFLKPTLDLKIWAFAVIFFCLTTVSYAIAFFLPIILRNGMGFSVAKSQCLVAPPYAAAALLMLATAWVGDKYHIRGPILVFNAIITLIGLPIMGFSTNKAAQYFGVFLVTAGANANIPACMTYQANNIRGQWKRAFCSASLVGFGGIGGIAGSLVFRSQDAPAYYPGFYASIVCNVVIILLVAILSVYFRICNSKQAKGLKIIEGQEGFRYTI